MSKKNPQQPQGKTDMMQGHSPTSTIDGKQSGAGAKQRTSDADRGGHRSGSNK